LDIVPAFANEAQATLDSLRNMRAQDRRLTIMLTGYIQTGQIVSSLISNFQDFNNSIDHAGALPTFSYLTEGSRAGLENPTLIQAVGQFSAIFDAESNLRKSLEDRRPAIALLEAAIGLIQKVSDCPRVKGTVGKKVTTARLDRLDPGVPVVGYATDQVEHGIPLLDAVDLRTGAPAVVVTGASIKTAEPSAFPRRNLPCPCGSGQKYRHCHGKFDGVAIRK
jgi:hypothetical protein